MGHWLIGDAGVLSLGVIFNLGSVKVSSPAIIETYCDKDILIAVNEYYMYL